jgi:hypothetical protein
MTEGYRSSLEDARRDLEHALKAREVSVQTTKDWDAKIVQLRRIVVSLAAYVGEASEMESMGITEAIRTVMNAATTRLKVRHVKDELTNLGFDLAGQDNADASIQAVLNRLVDKKEIRRESERDKHGRNVAVYVGPNVK